MSNAPLWGPNWHFGIKDCAASSQGYSRDMPAHGIMFHHFQDELHRQGQGALTAGAFENIIQNIGRDRILSPKEWMSRATTGRLEDNDVCLTFDDALRCQFDVALPVLRDMGLTGFWFVYSSIYHGTIETLEIYRYFRTVVFDSVDDFYFEFDKAVSNAHARMYETAVDTFPSTNHLAQYPVYSESDRFFRYLRDVVLSEKQYHKIMQEMMAVQDFQGQNVSDLLWLDEQHLETLHSEGHLIGLHSHTHSTQIAAKSFAEQKSEYERNLNHLTSLLGVKIDCMAHPCNSYNDDTLKILTELGIRVGFRANMEEITNPSMYEFPRLDHADALKKVNA